MPSKFVRWVETIGLVSGRRRRGSSHEVRSWHKGPGDFILCRTADSEHPKQFHVDFEVDDIEAERSRVLALGAILKRDSTDPDGYGFRVYTDLVGRPFCLCRNRGVIWTDPGLIRPKCDQ